MDDITWIFAKLRDKYGIIMPLLAGRLDLNRNILLFVGILHV